MDQIGMQTTDLSTEIFFHQWMQYNHKENLSYDKTSKSMLENRCRPRMFIVDPNKRTSGSFSRYNLSKSTMTLAILEVHTKK
jgi:hypothetical protein